MLSPFAVLGATVYRSVAQARGETIAGSALVEALPAAVVCRARGASRPPCLTQRLPELHVRRDVAQVAVLRDSITGVHSGRRYINHHA